MEIKTVGRRVLLKRKECATKTESELYKESI